MDLLALRIGVILELWTLSLCLLFSIYFTNARMTYLRLEVLSAIQHANLANWRIGDVVQRITGRISKECALDMCRLDLPAMK